MKCLVVLSHLMSQECELGAESCARARLAIDKFNADKFEFLITSGWAYRDDCETPISDVVKDFIIENSGIESDSVISLSASRDTVGDAYYCLEYFQQYPIQQLHVITSDYHVNRAEIIFKKLFSGRISVTVFGAKTVSICDENVQKHEARSINAFEHTFLGTDCSDIRSIHHTLSIRHPFYNGEIHPKI